MSRLLRPFLVLIAVSFFVSVSYAAAKKPAGQGGGGGGAKATTEMCKFLGTGVTSDGAVEVGIDVKTYGPPITLNLSLIAVSSFGGPFDGAARVLKKDGRMDFYFDQQGSGCGGPQFKSSHNVCPYRLILLDGIYDRHADTVLFGPSARIYLYVDDGSTDPLVEGEVKDGESVTIDFEPYDD